ncbi:hypothetical protein NXV12_21470 [Bacteroides thetaiotaomicron]|nr:hypothetical protein [Bacteroides thetaiotaomicron]
MIQELFSWLDAQRITYIPVDTEVVDIPRLRAAFHGRPVGSGIHLPRRRGQARVQPDGKSGCADGRRNLPCGLPVRQELVLL